VAAREAFSWGATAGDALVRAAVRLLPVHGHWSLRARWRGRREIKSEGTVL